MLREESSGQDWQSRPEPIAQGPSGTARSIAREQAGNLMGKGLVRPNAEARAPRSSSFAIGKAYVYATEGQGDYNTPYLAVADK